MGQPVTCVGDLFRGYCSACPGVVVGRMVTGEFLALEGRNVCVTGSIGRDDAGHTCQAIGLSTAVTIEGKAVVRVGDPVTGTIEGVIITGSDFVSAD